MFRDEVNEETVSHGRHSRRSRPRSHDRPRMALSLLSPHNHNKSLEDSLCNSDPTQPHPKISQLDNTPAELGSRAVAGSGLPSVPFASGPHRHRQDISQPVRVGMLERRMQAGYRHGGRPIVMLRGARCRRSPRAIAFASTTSFDARPDDCCSSHWQRPRTTPYQDTQASKIFASQTGVFKLSLDQRSRRPRAAHGGQSRSRPGRWARPRFGRALGKAVAHRGRASGTLRAVLKQRVLP